MSSQKTLGRGITDYGDTLLSPCRSASATGAAAAGLSGPIGSAVLCGMARAPGPASAKADAIHIRGQRPARSSASVLEGQPHEEQRGAHADEHEAQYGQCDFARRPTAEIRFGGRRPRAYTCAENVPEHDDLRDGAIIPSYTRSAECHKNSISKGAGRNKGNVKMLLAVIRSDLLTQ
jgi:hypothetical protein